MKMMKMVLKNNSKERTINALNILGRLQERYHMKRKIFFFVDLRKALDEIINENRVCRCIEKICKNFG